MSDGGAVLPRRPLGSTGLELSVLGFGASPLGGSFGAVDDSVGIAAVHHAFRRGINFFDTSPFYGLTKSETVLGQALRDLPRSELVLATKVGRYGHRPADFDFSAARVTASVAESLARLQVSYIDIIQCHDIEFGDLDQIVNETLPALAALRSQGLVRHVGITGLPLEALQYVLDRAAPGSVDTVLSYCHYCLNDTTLAAAIPALRAKGAGVINASPLSMGLLTRAGPPAWHPAPPPLREAVLAATAHAEGRGHDIAALGMRFAMRQPDVASTLVGMYDIDLVDKNISATLQALGLEPGSGAEGADADAVLGEVLQMLEPVKDLSWPSGRPVPRG
ncbi:L-galactose dehydrogenase [Tetrabaena socialis]|uniref:L-galactose dehydrogenase n=1 Tax=Tetrabaena socialis TaxID=47790 RepID=A0A2J8AGR0_9CHLO|nr:L-galactose dehydrogenase [Tetrabaena socialis]|eukprot:PNH11710.1 L-galactose dehydrogenase [Tetrabaena socialis]